MMASSESEQLVNKIIVSKDLISWVNELSVSVEKEREKIIIPKNSLKWQNKDHSLLQNQQQQEDFWLLIFLQ